LYIFAFVYIAVFMCSSVCLSAFLIMILVNKPRIYIFKDNLKTLLFRTVC